MSAWVQAERGTGTMGHALRISLGSGDLRLFRGDESSPWPGGIVRTEEDEQVFDGQTDRPNPLRRGQDLSQGRSRFRNTTSGWLLACEPGGACFRVRRNGGGGQLGLGQTSGQSQSAQRITGGGGTAWEVGC